ncbi:hypothetical protein M4D81_18885 [Paenibacillus sp. p3-SID867]|uniref:hypothetical protein n=1 Tax=Paenibacillus sp. p3-SID867 TaxID=2916363 RepID=UPI0021A9703A|nr:hypothetical protein [Paenibacillus sp. p3-SID867]MCT1401099.1 hypothetical protein [Paenibacillus sp. p3-SID867]
MDTLSLHIKVLVLHLEDMQKVIYMVPESWMSNDKLRCDILFLWEAINDESILDKLIFKPEIETVKYAPGAIIWAIDKINVNKGNMTKLIGTELYRQMTIRNLNTTRKIVQLMLAADEDER